MSPNPATTLACEQYSGMSHKCKVTHRHKHMQDRGHSYGKCSLRLLVLPLKSVGVLLLNYKEYKIELLIQVCSSKNIYTFPYNR